MRFMAIVKATDASEAGVMPDEEMLAAMGKFNQELIEAGVMLSGDGLHPSSKGTRIVFEGGSRSVVDGPFIETKELIAGYWMLQVQSKEEAIEWMRRCPHPHPGTDTNIEIRQVFELSDFGSSEAVEHHERLRQQMEG